MAQSTGTLRRMVLAALVCAIAAGCTGGDDATPVTSVVPVTTVTLPTTIPVPDVSIATSFFSTIAQRTSVTTNAALQFAVPGSPAAHFVLHQAAVLRLVPAADTASAAATATGFSICGNDATCVDYGEVDIDPTSGLVNGFVIDGIPLAGRVVADGAPGSFEGGTITVTSAYRSNADELTVVASIDNTSIVDLTPFGFAATYQPLTARASVEATGVWGPDVIPAGSVAEILVVFGDRPFGDAPLTDTDFGGQLRLTALRSDGIDLSLDAIVPTG